MIDRAERIADATARKFLFSELPLSPPPFLIPFLFLFAAPRLPVAPFPRGRSWLRAAERDLYICMIPF